MATVCHLNSHLMAAPHSNGQDHLSMARHSSAAEVVDVVDSMVVVAAMKPLLWALQFVWVLTIMSETTWLKRAMASLHNMQIIRLPQLHSPSLRIKVIHHKVFLNVRHLTPIPTTLAPLIGVEEI
jgi:hypothetical protein